MQNHLVVIYRADISLESLLTLKNKLKREDKTKI